MEDYYAILSVTPATPLSEIKSSYRRLALRLHPDKNPSPDATILFQQVGRAWETLNNPQKRRTYDLKRENELAKKRKKEAEIEAKKKRVAELEATRKRQEAEAEAIRLRQWAEVQRKRQEAELEENKRKKGKKDMENEKEEYMFKTFSRNGPGDFSGVRAYSYAPKPQPQRAYSNIWSSNWSAGAPPPPFTYSQGRYGRPVTPEKPTHNQEGFNTGNGFREGAPSAPPRATSFGGFGTGSPRGATFQDQWWRTRAKQDPQASPFSRVPREYFYSWGNAGDSDTTYDQARGNTSRTSGFNFVNSTFWDDHLAVQILNWRTVTADEYAYRVKQWKQNTHGLHTKISAAKAAIKKIQAKIDSYNTEVEEYKQAYKQYYRWDKTQSEEELDSLAEQRAREQLTRHEGLHAAGHLAALKKQLAGYQKDLQKEMAAFEKQEWQVRKHKSQEALAWMRPGPIWGTKVEKWHARDQQNRAIWASLAKVKQAAVFCPGDSEGDGAHEGPWHDIRNIADCDDGHCGRCNEDMRCPPFLQTNRRHPGQCRHCSLIVCSTCQKDLSILREYEEWLDGKRLHSLFDFDPYRKKS